MPKLLGIDIGTSGCKAVLIDGSGRVLAKATAEYPLHTPKPGRSEQNPQDWWTGVQECLGAIQEAPDAIGLTGQMHGSVFLDKEGEVIRPALLWNDQRTQEECKEIEDRVGAQRLRAITRNPALTGFQAPKILWLRNREQQHFKRLHKVLLPKDYIRYKLTGELATDVADASGTGLLDVPARTWSEEILQALELDQAILPTCYESHETTGRTREGTPVVAGAGDQAAGAVGTGATVPGIVSISLGTSGVVFSSLDQPKYDPEGSVHTFCHANGAWHAMAVMLSCGGAIRWYRDTFRPGLSFDQLAQEANGAEPGCNGLVFLPYLAGERSPHNDPAATGVWAGATLAHGAAHFGRAVFEGVTMALRDCLDAMTPVGCTAERLRVTGGGAKSPFWMQLLADTLETPCVPVQADEGPAFGASLLAGVGIGVWPDVTTAGRQTLREGETYEPRLGRSGSQARFRDLYQANKAWFRAPRGH